MPGERREGRGRVNFFLEGVRRLNEVIDGVPGPQPHATTVRDIDPVALDEAATLVDRTLHTLLKATGLPPPIREQSAVLLGEDLGGLVRSVAARREPPINFGEFLAWKALRRVTRGAAGAGNTCPSCGSLPAMATLVTTERGRERELCCGLCGTRWKYARIGCPYCGASDQLGVLEPESEESFRIDVCRSCNSYLKTYVGDQSDPQALSDWSTLHLDSICQERGLNRPGPSLYSL